MASADDGYQYAMARIPELEVNLASVAQALERSQSENVALKDIHTDLVSAYKRLQDQHQRLRAQFRQEQEERHQLAEDHEQQVAAWRSQLGAKAKDMEDLQGKLVAPSDIDAMRLQLMEELYVLGSMMAGTTSLCAKLRQSPAVVWPRARGMHQLSARAGASSSSKESHYFDLVACAACDMMSMASVTFSEFGQCQRDTRQVPIDGTARYLVDPDVPHAMAQFYGTHRKRVKFLMLLREPLQRTQSHFYHSKLYGWCADHAKQTFSDVADAILGGDDSRWLGSTANPRGAGCGDFLESSMYVKLLKRWFGEFGSSQFTITPFQYNTEPGKDGRPSNKDMVEDLWRQLGVHGLVGEQVHANQVEHPPLWEDLDPIRISKMYRYFEPKTGPLRLAALFSASQASLYQYVGSVRDADTIASWLRKHW